MELSASRDNCVITLPKLSRKLSKTWNSLSQIYGSLCLDLPDDVNIEEFLLGDSVITKHLLIERIN